MSREAMVKLYSGNNVQPIIYHHECFGWELIQITDTRLVFSRETQDEVYDELVMYENVYLDLIKQKNSLVSPIKPKNKKPFNLLLCLFLFVLCIIPGIIYLVINNKNKETYENELKLYYENVECYKDQLTELNTNMANTLAKSRTLFFSKRKKNVKLVEENMLDKNESQNQK